MARLLADENVARDVVSALESDGHDVIWFGETGPGSIDDVVLSYALAENRILLTLIKTSANWPSGTVGSQRRGLILLRPRLKTPEYLARFARAVLDQALTWEGHFAVAEEGRIRLVPLPGP